MVVTDTLMAMSMRVTAGAGTERRGGVGGTDDHTAQGSAGQVPALLAVLGIYAWLYFFAG